MTAPNPQHAPPPDAPIAPQPGRRWRLRRWLFIILTPAVIVTGLMTALVGIPSARYYEARREAVARLANAADQTSLKAAIGRGGIVLHLASGDWIAIAYTDSHSATFAFSCAVALCSDGSWMESSVHFCGKFSGYRSTRDMALDPGMDEEWRAGFANDRMESDLYAVENAPSLKAARDLMSDIGFSNSRFDATPAMIRP